jgi:hypothetical protein
MLRCCQLCVYGGADACLELSTGCLCVPTDKLVVKGALLSFVCVWWC